MTDSNQTNTISCPHCKEAVQQGATTCPHCKGAIFSPDPGTNAVIGFVSFVILFGLLWTGTNWLAKMQAEQNFRDAQQQVDKMMKE